MTAPMALQPATMPNLPTPAGPSGRGEGEAGPDRFASMLGAARADDAAAPQPSPRRDAGEAPARGARPGAKARGQAASDVPGRRDATGTVADPTGKSAPATAADIEALTAKDGTTPDAPSAGAEDDAPALAALLPGWPPVTPPATPGPAGSTGPVTADTLAEAKPESMKRTAAVAAADPGAAAMPTAATDAAEARIASDAPHARAPKAVRSEDPAAEALAPRHPSRDAGPRTAAEAERAAPTPTTAVAAAALAAVAGGSTAATPHASAVVHAHVSPPLDSPSFTPALATQVRWLVQEGVSQAQLQLHPAEMGPVSVKIVVEGREARIDFGADVAATRQVLEASLPVLAAALDDSGIKLTGGSVRDGQPGSQQSGHPRQPGGSHAAPRDVGADAGLPNVTTVQAARGLVDLVA